MLVTFCPHLLAFPFGHNTNVLQHSKTWCFTFQPYPPKFYCVVRGVDVNKRTETTHFCSLL